jgi:hypothetical protein
MIYRVSNVYFENVIFLDFFGMFNLITLALPLAI